MGVDRTDYIVYGYKLPYRIENKNEEIDLWDEKFLPMIEGHQGEEFTIVRDVVLEKYVVFGKLIERCEGGYVGWDFVHLDIDQLDAEKVKSKYREVFELEEDESIAEPHLFIFSHFD